MNNTSGNSITKLKKQIGELKNSFPKNKLEKIKMASLLGKLVKKIREQKSWTVHKLAKVIDKNMGALVELEQGKQLPTVSILERIAKALEQGEHWKW